MITFQIQCAVRSQSPVPSGSEKHESPSSIVGNVLPGSIRSMACTLGHTQMDPCLGLLPCPSVLPKVDIPDATQHLSANHPQLREPRNCPQAQCSPSDGPTSLKAGQYRGPSRRRFSFQNYCCFAHTDARSLLCLLAPSIQTSVSHVIFSFEPHSLLFFFFFFFLIF